MIFRGKLNRSSDRPLIFFLRSFCPTNLRPASREGYPRRGWCRRRFQIFAARLNAITRNPEHPVSLRSTRVAQREIKRVISFRL